jgi:large subunit ribosomal protein L1
MALAHNVGGERLCEEEIKIITEQYRRLEIMELKEQLKKALSELRKEKQRKFEQTVDLIINLQKFDPKKSQINFFVSVPQKIKDKKICAFLETKNKDIETITPNEFKKYSDKKELKKLVKNYDFFIAQAGLMPKVATTFGRALGPAGKMPSPQLGILADVNEKSINGLKKTINNNLKIRIKEPSIKVAVGKQNMKDEEIAENIMAIYNSVLKTLPKEKDNIKNLEIKFTMTKPQKIQIR